jgi:hypothetical protein
MKTGQTTSSQTQDNQHDPPAHDGARWGQLNKTHNEFHDYANNAEITAPEMASDEDDLAAILDLPSAKSEREDRMDDRCEGADVIIEINMTVDAKNKTKGHETVPTKIDKIVVRRPFNNDKPDQGVCETITVGMTVTCKTCLNTEIEGKILAFDANTKMIVIKPTLALDQPLRKGPHMVNLDYIKNISIVRECMNKPPETTTTQPGAVHVNTSNVMAKVMSVFQAFHLSRVCS